MSGSRIESVYDIMDMEDSDRNKLLEMTPAEMSVSHDDHFISY